MKVAAANPNRPRTEGAAYGCSMTRGRAKPSSHSVPLSTVTTRRASLAMTFLLSLLLRDHRVARIPRRLEAGLEDRPPQCQLAREDERASRRSSRTAPPAPEGEQPGACDRARLRDLVELPGLALRVD